MLDGFSQRDFVLWVFVYPINIILFLLLFHGYHAEGYHAPSIPHGLPRLYHHCTAITSVYISRLPRQGLPRPILTTTGYHACVYIPVITPELSRSTIHVHRVITPAISNSYFVVYLSHFTPPLLLLHHHRAPHATTYPTCCLLLLLPGCCSECLV